MVAVALITACETTGTGQSAAAQNEALLAHSGFKTVAVTTPKQQQAVSKLPQGTVSAVKYQGKTYYVYPTGAKDKIYVGKQTHVNAAQNAGGGATDSGGSTEHESTADDDISGPWSSRRRC